MDGRVCVLSRFLLHVVILEFLELALFNDTVARVGKKHSHGVCMHKCTPCTAAVLVCTHVTPYPSSPMLTVSPGISRKHFVQNRYLHTYTHTQTGSEDGALAERLICRHFEVSWTKHLHIITHMLHICRLLPRAVRGR